MQFLWQQLVASDCDQERHHTLANWCPLSSAVSFALCCHSRSLLLQSLSCRTAWAQVLGVVSMMHTTARDDGKSCRQRNRYPEAGWKVTYQPSYRDCAFPMAGSSIVTNPTVPGDHYANARALCTLLLLQAAPLKYALAQTRQCVPDSQAGASKRVKETMCKHHCGVLQWFRGYLSQLQFAVCTRSRGTW